MERFPIIGHSYCVQCSTSRCDHWSCSEFFSSYTEALAYQRSCEIKFKRLVFRIVHCNLVICDD